MDVLTNKEKMFLDKAFEYAHEALSKLEVPVGCIFIYNNEIIASGRNTVNETRNATCHAEMNCIEQVTKYCKENNLDLNVVFQEICVFVTVEPCIMCISALFDLKVREIVFGCKNDRFGGKTVVDVSLLKPNDTVVKGGYRDEEAMDLLKKFYSGVNPSAPPEKAKIRGKKIV